MINEKEVVKFVKPFYAKRDSMHNFAHILRIKKKISFLKRQYSKLNKEFLNFLIYFHGSRKWAKKNKNKIVVLGYSASWIDKINSPTTPEGKLVWDANCLENVGRYGIKRTLALEKHYGQTREKTLKLANGFIPRYKFYTPLGKKMGNEGIKIKKEWLRREIDKLKR